MSNRIVTKKTITPTGPVIPGSDNLTDFTSEILGQNQVVGTTDITTINAVDSDIIDLNADTVSLDNTTMLEEMNINNYKISNLARPTNNKDAATKKYTDDKLAYLKWKEPCRVATTTEITLSGLQTIDGVFVDSDDRVLVKDQTNEYNNGYYNASTGSWSRTSDMQVGVDAEGFTCMVTEGLVNAEIPFTCVTYEPDDIVGTDPVTFSQFGGGIIAINDRSYFSQQMVTGSSGTDFNIQSSGFTHTFNIPDASSSSRGLVTTSDWSTFNNKLSPSVISNNIYIGSGSNLPVSRTLTGDFTITDTGSSTANVTLANTSVTPGSYTASTIDVTSKGLLVDVTDGTGFASPSGPVNSVQYRDSNAGFIGSSTLIYDGTLNITFGTEATTSVIKGPDATTLDLDGSSLKIRSGSGPGSGLGSGSGGSLTFDGSIINYKGPMKSISTSNVTISNFETGPLSSSGDFSVKTIKFDQSLFTNLNVDDVFVNESFTKNLSQSTIKTLPNISTKSATISGSNVTYNWGQLTSGLVVRTGLTSGSNDILPDASTISNYLASVSKGTNVRFTILNNSSYNIILNEGTGVTISGNNFILANAWIDCILVVVSSTEVKIINLTEIPAGSIVSDIYTGDTVLIRDMVMISPTHLFVAREGVSAQVYDVSDPLNPIAVVSSGLQSVNFVGNLVSNDGYLLTWVQPRYQSTYYLYDVNDPTSPVMVDTGVFGTEWWRMQIGSNLAFWEDGTFIGMGGSNNNGYDSASRVPYVVGNISGGSVTYVGALKATDSIGYHNTVVTGLIKIGENNFGGSGRYIAYGEFMVGNRLNNGNSDWKLNDFYSYNHLVYGLQISKIYFDILNENILLLYHWTSYNNDTSFFLTKYNETGSGSTLVSKVRTIISNNWDSNKDIYCVSCINGKILASSITNGIAYFMPNFETLEINPIPIWANNSINALMIRELPNSDKYAVVSTSDGRIVTVIL